MRLIDADNIKIPGDANYKASVKRVIEQQPTVQQWISVLERLPEKKGQYLVTYHPCYWEIVQDELCVGIDNFMGKKSWSKRKYQNVVAWMPLPEEYK